MSSPTSCLHQAVVYPNNVPEVQERSERSGRSERSERAEQCSEHSWACCGHVAKISMLRLNIGSGKLSSCMLSIGRGPKAVQGKGRGCPPCLVRIPRQMLSMYELSLPEPMLSLSMLILATTLLLPWTSPFETQVKTDIPKFQHVDFW